MGSGASSPGAGAGADDAGADDAGVEVKVRLEGLGLVEVGFVQHDLTVGELKQVVEKRTRGKPYAAERMQLWLDGATLDDDRRTLYGVGCEGSVTLDITDAQSNAHLPPGFQAFDGSFKSVDGTLSSIMEKSPPPADGSMRKRSASEGTNSTKAGTVRRGSSGGGDGPSGGDGGMRARRLTASAKRARNVRVHVEVAGVHFGEAASSTLTLHIDQESTVARLKSALEEQTGIVVAKQVVLLTSNDGTPDVELDDDKRTVFGSRIDEGAQLKLVTTRQRRLQLGLGGEGEGEGKGEGYWDFAQTAKGAPSERSNRQEQSPKPAVDSDHEHEEGSDDGPDDEQLAPLLIRLYVQVEGRKGELVLKVSQDLLVADLKAGLADTVRVPLRQMELLLRDVEGASGKYVPLTDDRRTCFGCLMAEGSQLLVRDKSARHQTAPAIADTFEGAVENKRSTSPGPSQAGTAIASVGKAASTIASADTLENAQATSFISPAAGGQLSLSVPGVAKGVGTGGASPGTADYWSRVDTMRQDSGRASVKGEDEFEVHIEVNGKATVNVTVTPDLLLGDFQEMLVELSGIKVHNQTLANTAGGEMGDQVEPMTDARRSLYGYFLEEGSRLKLKGKVTKKPKAASFAAAARTAEAGVSGKGAGGAAKTR